MNIVKELNKVAARNAQAEIDESNKILDSVKAHLSDEAKADDDMLKYFGVLQVTQEQQSFVSFNEKRLTGAVLKIEDIETICNRYALRFLPAKQYIKAIPTKALNDLRNFQQTNKIESLEGESFKETGLYIIAPVSHFKLGPKPKKDPVLIWRDKESYTVVSQWGSDFDWRRRLLGWVKTEMDVFIMSTYGIVGLFFIGYYSYLGAVSNVDYFLIIPFFLLAGIIAFGITRIFDGSSNWDKSTK